MSRTTQTVILVGVVLAGMSTAHAAAGSAILDQVQELDSGGGYFWAERYWAQTFTPGMSAQLDHIDLHIDVWTGQPSVPATISVVETVSGVPNGPLVGAVNVPSFTLGWDSIDFLPETVMLTAGKPYGIVLSNDDPSADEPSDGIAIQWDGDVYPRGQLWQWTPSGGWEVWGTGVSDAAFRTWMVPEPATLSLLAVGALALVRRRDEGAHRCRPNPEMPLAQVRAPT